MTKILNFFQKNGWTILLGIILVVSSVIKVLEVSGGNFPFTMDQGRDMVDIRHMVVTFSPRLVGPTTSINGVLLGPFWYYFNFIPFILTGGNPSAIVYWQIIWYQISVVALWYVIKKQNRSFAAIVAMCLFLMPTGFNTARYFWNANSMPFFTTFFFAALIVAAREKTARNLLLLGLISGLSMQIEAAFGLLLFPFAFLYLLFDKTKIKQMMALIIGFGATLIPQILFELKHSFIMTKVLLSEFGGKGDMLGEKINMSERIAQRWEHLNLLVLRSSHLPPNWVPYIYLFGLLLLLSLIVFRSKKASLKPWSMSLYFLLFSAIFYLLFPQKLKIWYTLGLSIPLVIFLSAVLNYLLECKFKILKVLAIFLIYSTIYYSVKSQTDYTRDVAFKPSDDRSNMRNELAAVDWVYQNAEGKGFKVFSYLPSVYDFPYNHLFWWYGNQKYGYQPFETAYLPGQPEYIRDVDKLWTNSRPLESADLTFLIIEKDVDMPSRTEAWLGNFSKLCTTKESTFPWGTQVKMMSPCKK